MVDLVTKLAVSFFVLATAFLFFAIVLDMPRGIPADRSTLLRISVGGFVVSVIFVVCLVLLNTWS